MAQLGNTTDWNEEEGYFGYCVEQALDANRTLARAMTALTTRVVMDPNSEHAKFFKHTHGHLLQFNTILSRFAEIVDEELIELMEVEDSG